MMLKQGLDQIAATMHPQIRAVLLFQFFDLCYYIICNKCRVLPWEVCRCMRYDVLPSAVEGFRYDGGFLCMRPVSGKDIIGSLPQKQFKRKPHKCIHNFAHYFIPVIEQPAAVGKATRCVFCWSARSLHHTI